MTKQFRESLLADLVHTVFLYAFFLFDPSTKKLFVSYYHVLLFCLAAVIVQVNTENNIQYL